MSSAAHRKKKERENSRIDSARRPAALAKRGKLVSLGSPVPGKKEKEAAQKGRIVCNFEKKAVCIVVGKKKRGSVMVSGPYRSRFEGRDQERSDPTPTGEEKKGGCHTTSIDHVRV